MVLGLLTIAAIPTTIGIGEAVANRNSEKEKAKDNETLRKFTLKCYCDSPSRKRGEIDGGDIVLRRGKIYINSPPSANVEPPPSYPFKGFYIEFPDPERKPQPLGLVTFCSDDPPALNWIYIDRNSRQLKHGNRTESKPHLVGPWGWESGEEGGPGGITYDGEEGAVAVETDEGWEIRWEDENAKVGRVSGGRVLNISLERQLVDEEDSHRKKEEDDGSKVVKVKDGQGGSGGGLDVKTTTLPTGSKTQEIRDDNDHNGGGGKAKVFEMKTTTKTRPLGKPDARPKKTESKLEVSTKTTED